MTGLAFDGDDTTYWEHNTQYQISKNVYFMVRYDGNVVALDEIRLKFAAPFKGRISITYQAPDDSWTAWGDNTWLACEIDESNNYELVLKTDMPQSLVCIAVGFMVGDGGWDIPSGEIKLATFEARCRNPIVEEISTFPSDWSVSQTENAGAYVNAFYGSTSVTEFNTLRLEDNNEAESLSVLKSFSKAGSITAEFKVYYEDLVGGNTVGIQNSEGGFLGITTKDSKLCMVAKTAAGEETLIPIENGDAALTGYSTELWYTVALKYDAQSNTASVDLNGWSPVDAVKLDQSFSGKTWSAFTAYTAQGKTAFQIDNVKIYSTQKESNVPEIEKCDTGDIILTMQACSLWREGTHIGWSALDNEEMSYRQPILGWYDEGTVEVADWEIKIAAEHGISNVMYCWYRAGSEGPIADSSYADAIWDGLFKSKFREEINFSIMFENTSGLYSYDDLIENLMPYWIEVFFKNPNYQKTAEGEPIFYIYSYTNFMNVIGDVNGDGEVNAGDVLVATNKMREMAVEAGLPGLYLVAEDRMASATTVRNIEGCGFDALFAYTFSTGTYNVSDDETLAAAQSILLSQRAAISDTENFSVIPNISKSWDPRGWTDYGFGNGSAPYMYDLEHYREFALWVKNVYGATEIDSSGTKMIMLDNWNEYSEGHWMMPTYGTPAYKDGTYGYGYLDVLREVFGINAYEHTDHLPLEEGYGPYDTWYPDGWEDPVNAYVVNNGQATDDSIAEQEIVDWEIGYDTVGGSTAYLSSVGTGDTLDLSDANRVVLTADVVEALQKANRGITLDMLYGSVSIPAEQLAKLDASKSLEIVLNKKLDVTAEAIAVRGTASGDYRLCDGQAVEYSVKQGGYAVQDMTAQVVIYDVVKATHYAECIDGVLGALTKVTAGNVKLTVSGNGVLTFIY